MLIHDDYSGTSFYTESEKYQPPVLSRAEQKEAKRQWDEWCFLLHLMRWGSLPDYPIDGFGRKIKEPINLDAWLEQEQKRLAADRQYLKRRQQERNRQHDTEHNNNG